MILLTNSFAWVWWIIYSIGGLIALALIIIVIVVIRANRVWNKRINKNK